MNFFFILLAATTLSNCGKILKSSDTAASLGIKTTGAAGEVIPRWMVISQMNEAGGGVRE